MRRKVDAGWVCVCGKGGLMGDGGAVWGGYRWGSSASSITASPLISFYLLFDSGFSCRTEGGADRQVWWSERGGGRERMQISVRPH